eukprot:2657411-Prymnesium_polylepis.1
MARRGARGGAVRRIRSAADIVCARRDRLPRERGAPHRDGAGSAGGRIQAAGGRVRARAGDRGRPEGGAMAA